MDIGLHYQQRGDGFPLVLLHGNGEDSGYFSSQMEYFSHRYWVIAPDTRGHGASPRGSAPFTLEQFAEDLKDFLDALGLTKVILLGFSDGGNIALLFTLKYPQYVEKLVLNGPDLNPAGVKRSVQLPIVFGYRLLSLFCRFYKKALPKREMLGLMVTQPDIDPAALAAITCPTLLVVGTRDMIRRDHSRLIADSIPGCRFAELEGDHFVAAKNSATFNAAVREFLAAEPRH